MDKIDIERSTACRPSSDCWDVKLTFFDPVQRHERAREIYRFTIDVSEVIPVTVGKVWNWSAYQAGGRNADQLAIWRFWGENEVD